MNELWPQRSLHHLRIDKNSAVGLILHLEEAYLGWFNDKIFQEVLSVLGEYIGKIIPNEDAGTSKTMKTGEVVTLRGENVQFACHLRKSETRRIVLMQKKEKEETIQTLTQMVKDKVEEEIDNPLNFHRLKIKPWTLVVHCEPYDADAPKPLSHIALRFSMTDSGSKAPSIRDYFVRKNLVGKRARQKKKQKGKRRKT